jgi:hypothetical protein
MGLFLHTRVFPPRTTASGCKQKKTQYDNDFFFHFLTLRLKILYDMPPFAFPAVCRGEFAAGRYAIVHSQRNAFRISARNKKLFFMT